MGHDALALLLTQNMTSNPLKLNTGRIEDLKVKPSKGEKRGEREGGRFCSAMAMMGTLCVDSFWFFHLIGIPGPAAPICCSL